MYFGTLFQTGRTTGYQAGRNGWNQTAKEFTEEMKKQKQDAGGQAGTEQSLWSAVGWARLSEAERFKRFNYARDKLGEVMKRWDNFSEPQRAERCER